MPTSPDSDRSYQQEPITEGDWLHRQSRMDTQDRRRESRLEMEGKCRGAIGDELLAYRLKTGFFDTRPRPQDGVATVPPPSPQTWPTPRTFELLGVGRKDRPNAEKE